MFGLSYYATENVRLYGEVGWAFYTDGVTQPWEFQFGAEYSPIYSPGFRGSPFVAINGHLRQEVAFGGSVNVQVGWQWLNGGTGTRMRSASNTSMARTNSTSSSTNSCSRYGIGVWYDY